ncbi:glycosyltransferase [Klebsiella spallanzanii]|uniref:glycosyltransferase n=1 Tax=Klebsiella spallanzanii TaxID=2587528 RepID=UPI00111A1389|nr:glycosyltransferase [Klebsiella spallanzanii]
MSKKKKILFVVDLLSGRGGMENVTRQLILQLNSDPQYSAGLFILNDGGRYASSAWRKGIVWGESQRITGNHKISRLFHVLQLAFFMLKNRPDRVVVLNTLPCLIARRAMKMSATSAKLSTWMHLPPRDRYRPRYLLLAEHHFAISRDIARQFIELGAAPESIDVVFNPVKRSSAIITRPQTLKLLYVGRVHFSDQKNLKELFDAVSQLNIPWSLDIVGDGEDLAQCQRYVDTLGLQHNITWHGWQENAWQYIENNLQEVSCLVLTSTQEGLPLVLLEAISRGIYCISSNCVSGPSDIIVSGVNGCLYEPGNVAELVGKITAIGSGAHLPAHDVINNSICDFYEDAYMSRFKQVLEK